jgi:DNA-binding transcriptional ArsR family regulator
MNHGLDVPDGRAAALRLLRELRQVDGRTGVRNSRIAFDVALLFYEASLGAEPALSVDQLAASSGYSGPTVRLVLKRLLDAGTVQPARRIGKTQLYAMTPAGLTGFAGYVTAILAFRGP